MAIYFKILAILCQYITISLGQYNQRMGQFNQRMGQSNQRTTTEDPNDWLYDIQARMPQKMQEMDIFGIGKQQIREETKTHWSENDPMTYYPLSCYGQCKHEVQFIVKHNESCPNVYDSSAPPIKHMMTAKNICKEEIAKLCTYCILKGPDGNDLSGTCNYIPSKDCKMYEDIRKGKCTECLKSTGEEATTKVENPKTTYIPKLSDLLTTTNSPKAQTTRSNMQIKENGLQIETLSGPTNCPRKVESGDLISVHYSGELTNGNVFDSSYQRNEPFTFKIGIGQVIKGWDQGIIGMCIGENRELVIPPELGYGQRGAGKMIPGGATLVFQVEMVALY